MTIDEAIAQEREVAKKNREICRLKTRENAQSIFKCAEEHEQLAEWLEELKDYRDKNKMVVRIDCINSEEFNDLAVKLVKEQYNKAIDDFVEKISIEISESIIWGMIADSYSNKNTNGETSEKIVDYVIETSKKVAEQLKAGENDA